MYIQLSTLPATYQYTTAFLMHAAMVYIQTDVIHTFKTCLSYKPATVFKECKQFSKANNIAFPYKVAGMSIGQNHASLYTGEKCTNKTVNTPENIHCYNSEILYVVNSNLCQNQPNNLLLISFTLNPHSGSENEAICRGWQLGLSLSLVLPVWVNRNVPSV